MFHIPMIRLVSRSGDYLLVILITNVNLAVSEVYYGCICFKRLILD